MNKTLFTFLALALCSCGKPGPQGPPGSQGLTGEQGVPGRDGADGQDAVLESIALCPEIEGAYPEYLLRFSSGLFGVYFDHSKKSAFLTRIIPGNYSTTDGRNCHFTVNENLEVI